MPDLRPDMSRLYQSLTEALGSSVQNINSSFRSFGHSCRNQLNRLNNQPNSSNNSTNLFIDNTESNDQNTNNNLAPPIPPTASNVTDSHRSSSNHHRNPCRSSSRNRHSLCRDREYRNAYHIYRNGMLNVRSLDKDRNVLAAVLSIIVIIVLANALAQPKWFSIYNDLCTPRYFTKSDVSNKASNDHDESPSIFDFSSTQYTQFRPQYYYNGPFHSIYSSSYTLTPVTIYGLTPDYKACANPQILALKRTIIGLCFLAIMCTLVQFFMDIMGTKRKWVNSMRVYAVGNIFCVILCVLIIGLCYFISVLYERVQLQQLFTKTIPAGSGSIWIKNRMINRSLASQLDYLTIHQIEVKFELSYYLVTLAGFLSILASAANLFRRPRQIFIERIGVNHCRARPPRITNNSDENSLLASDALNSQSGTESPISQFLPPYPYSSNDWWFDPNLNLFYNSAANNHSSGSNQARQPTQNTNSNNFPPTMVLTNPPPPPCPPPPPYSP